jgi:tetratricopeptide (TPR) repeat protein
MGVEEGDEVTLADEDLVAESDLVGAPVEGPMERALRQLKANDEHDAALKHWHAELDGETDRGRQALFEYETGEILERRGDEAGAVKAYARSLTADSSFRPNLWAIRRVFARRGLWDKLLKLLEAESRHARDDSERGHAALEKAWVLEDKLAQPAAAQKSYEDAHQALPSAVASIPLWRLAVERQDRGGERSAVRDLAERTVDPARRVALLLELAQLEEAAGDPSEAFAVLDRALEAGTDRGRVLEAHQALAERTGQVDRLLHALELCRVDAEAALAEIDPPSGDDDATAIRAIDPVQRAQRLTALAEAGRREAHAARAAGDVERARAVLEAVYARAPANALLVEDLLELYEDLGDDAALVTLVGGVANVELAERPALLLRRIEGLIRLGRHEESTHAIAELRAAGPPLLPLVALEQRLALAARDLPAFAALQAEIAAYAVEHDDRRWGASAWTSHAALARRLGNADEALASVDRALAAVDGYAPAEHLKEELLVALGRRPERADLLRKQADRATGAQRAEVLERLLAVKLDELGDLDGALAILDELDPLKPSDRRLLFTRAEVLDRAGRPAELASILSELADGTSDPDLYADLKVDAGVLVEETGGETGPEQARELYRAALGRHPGHPAARAALQTSLERAGDLAALSKWYVEEARSSTSEELAVGHLEAGLSLALAAGRDDAPAIASELFDRSPTANSARVVARLSIADARVRTEALTRAAELAEDASLRVEALESLGETCEAAGHVDQALEAYDAALKAAPDVASEHASASASALLGAYELAAARGDARTAAEALDTLASLAGQGAPSPAFTLAAAGLLAASDPAAATERAHSVWATDGALAASILSAGTAARAGDLARHAQALDHAERNVQGPAARTSLALRAHAAQQQLGDAEGGGGAARAEQVDPTHRGSVLRAYDTVLEPARRAALCEARASWAEGGAQVGLLVEAGDNHAAAADLAAAARCYEAALQIEPRSMASLEGLRRVARAGGDLDGAARTSLRLAALCKTSARTASLLVEAGELYERMSRARDAAAAYRQALELHPDDRDLAERLCGLLRREKASDLLIEALSFRIDHLALLEDAALEGALYAERAALWRAAGKPDGAIADFQRALGVRSGDAESMVALAELLTDRDARAACQLYQQAAAQATDRQIAGGLHLRAARLLAGPLADGDAAVAQTEQAAALLEDDPDALDVLVEIQLGRNDKGAAAAALRRVGRRTGGLRRSNADVRAARLFEEIGDAAQARSALEEAVGAAPLGVEPVTHLASLLRATDVGAANRALSGAIDRQREALERKVGMERVEAIAELASARGDERLARHARAALAHLEGRSLRADPDPGEPPNRPASAGALASLRHPGLAGLAAEVLTLMEAAIGEALEVELTAAGVQKADRVAPKNLAARAPLVVAALAFFGVGEVEVYVDGARADRCEVLPGKSQRLVVGGAVAGGSAPATRYAIGRAAYSLQQGLSGFLAERDPQAVLTAARAAAGIPGVPSDPRSAAIARVVGRKERKGLQGLAAGLARPDALDGRALRVAAEVTMARGALLFSGDLSSAIDALRGLAPSAGEDPPIDLIRFALSQSFAALRAEVLQ